ncbi:MAG: hypothetical protein IKM73_02865 [Acidaminococcaceae bacterium]|nr:hypothetical protein [Acidaminococcaceae bacterium]
MLGDNLKVHFAGSEQIDFSLVANKAGVNYFLWTCFPFISDQFGIKGFPITCKNLFPPHEIAKFAKHDIMDSGLFTLMFGAHKGKRDKAFLLKWQYAMIDFIKKNNIKATCVECDCQKVLGVEEAWQFRRIFRDAVHNQIINVFHYEDGNSGLDRLIEFSPYIAISVPELRIVKPKTYKDDVYRLACYVKNKKPEIKIHLLGCTEVKLLERCNFCTTADSTSWQAVNRFGRILGNHVKTIRPEVKQRCAQAVRETLAACNIEETPKRMDYYSNYYISAWLHKREYERYAGSQE